MEKCLAGNRTRINFLQIFSCFLFQFGNSYQLTCDDYELNSNVQPVGTFFLAQNWIAKKTFRKNVSLITVLNYLHITNLYRKYHISRYKNQISRCPLFCCRLSQQLRRQKKTFEIFLSGNMLLFMLTKERNKLIVILQPPIYHFRS